MTLKMDAVENVWKPFLKLGNLAFVKYQKKFEWLNFLLKDAKFVAALAAIQEIFLNLRVDLEVILIEDQSLVEDKKWTVRIITSKI